MKMWEDHFDEISALYNEMRSPILTVLSRKSEEEALPIIWSAIAELYFSTLFMIQSRISDPQTVSKLKDLWKWIGDQKQSEIVQEAAKRYSKKK